MVGLSTPIEQPSETKAFPPIHKHEEEVESHHFSESDKDGENEGTPAPIIRSIVFEDDPKQPSILPSLLNQDKVDKLPVENSENNKNFTSTPGSQNSAKDEDGNEVSLVSLNYKEVNFNNEEVNFNNAELNRKQTDIVEKSAPPKSTGLAQNSEITMGTIDFSEEEVDSPLNDFEEPFSKLEVKYSYIENEEEPFHETEPESGIHGVKMINGHLHFKNT